MTRRDFVDRYRGLWDKWEVRAAILLSLLLQVFLIFSAPFRKRKSKVATPLRLLTWLAYLAADAVAMFALGLLSDSLDLSRSRSRLNPIFSNKDPTVIDKYNDLLAFWAPFLLLHLGGPDTITAFALEDNELWLRHLLWLLVEVTVAGYVLARSLPNNTLLFPTLLMFAAGTIRYVERTWALYLASNDGFKGSIPQAVDPGTNYSKLIDEYKINKEAGLPTTISIPEEYPSAPLQTDAENHFRELVMAAFTFFTTFKRLIPDLLLSFNERKQSFNFLVNQNREAEQAFEVMDIELRFAYDILYTKAAVIHNRTGYITRAICFTLIFGSFLFFWFLPKHEIMRSDVKITYALLGGAIVLDIVGFFYLIFSDWTIISLVNHSKLRSVISKIITFRRRGRSMYVTQYNLINSCLVMNNRYYLNKMGKLSKTWLVSKILDNLVHTSDTVVDEHLKNFIFEELRKKAKEATDLESSRRLSSCRGDSPLKRYEDMQWTVNEVEFVESVLLWHIATDLCYQKDLPQDKEKAKGKNQDENVKEVKVLRRIGKVISEYLCYQVLSPQDEKKKEKDKNQDENEREKVKDQDENVKRVKVPGEISKVISEYMLYLLVLNPSMISSIEGIRQIKFRDACEETMSIIKAKNLKDKVSARETLLSLSKEMLDRTRLVLFDACYLVQILLKMDLEERWKIISEVWAELSAYAASHCRGNYHAKCLSTGGELLTHVWFLMAHLGLGQQYHVVSSHANAKVIVEK